MYSLQPRETIQIEAENTHPHGSAPETAVPPQVAPPATNPVQPKVKRKRQNPMLPIALFIAGLTCLVIGLIVGTLPPEQIGGQMTPTPTSTITTTPTQTPTTTPTIITSRKRVVYIAPDGVYVMSVSGDNKIKVKDLSVNENISYMSPAWKSQNEVSYASCNKLTAKCDLYVVDVITKAVTTEAGDLPGHQFYGIWGDEKDYVYGLFLNPPTSGGMSKDALYVKNGATATQLVSFSVSDFFVENYKDDIIRFSRSADKSKVLAFTLRAGSSGDDYNTNTYVFTKTGNKVMELKSVSAAFISDKQIAYIYRDTLHVADIGGQDTATYQIVLNADEVLNQLRTVNSSGKVSFWSENKGNTNVFMYDLTTKKRVQISSHFLPEGEWISNTEVLGRVSTPHTNDPRGYTAEKGLSVLNSDSGTVTSVTTDTVLEYAIEQ